MWWGNAMPITRLQSGPPVDGMQRPMYFDFQVGDLDSAVADAVALGASLAAAQPQENVRVLFDPVGHPF
jgi:Glyoxalase-like domain